MVAMLFKLKYFINRLFGCKIFDLEKDAKRFYLKKLQNINRILCPHDRYIILRQVKVDDESGKILLLVKADRRTTSELKFIKNLYE